MKIRDILAESSLDGYIVDNGIAEVKQLLKCNNKPYTIKDGVEGPETVVVFSEHFITTMRDADSNECMAKMSKLEKRLYWDYTNYQSIVNSIMLANPLFTDAEVDAAAKSEYETDITNITTPELVVRKLSDWAYAEVLQFDKDSCYSTMHVWE